MRTAMVAAKDSHNKETKFMDIQKIKAALTTAQTELNAVTDQEFQARRLQALRPLTLAAQAIGLAVTHIDNAAKRTEPKAPAAPKVDKKK